MEDPLDAVQYLGRPTRDFDWSGIGSADDCTDDRHRVGVNIEAGVGTRHVVRHDQIGVLPLALGFRAFNHVFGFGGKPDEDGAAPFRQTTLLPDPPGCPACGAMSASTCRPVPLRLSPFSVRRATLACSPQRPPPSRRHRRPRRGHHGAMHLFSTANVDHLVHGGCCTLRRTGDQRHLRATTRRFGGNGKPHFAARSIADITHRIEVFVGRTSRDQHPLCRAARYRCRSIASAATTISSGSARRPLPIQPHARYPSPGSTKRTPRDASVSRFARTAACSNICVFIAGASNTGARVAVYKRRQEIVGDAVGELADDIRRRRSHQQKVDRGSDGDVFDVGVHPGLELIRDDMAPRDRFERDRPDETGRGMRHHATTSWPRFCKPRATSTAL